MKVCVITHESNGSIRVTAGGEMFAFANASALAESFAQAKADAQLQTAYVENVRMTLNNTPVPTEDARNYRDHVLKVISEEMPF